MAAVAVSAVARHRPRRSSAFRLSYVFGLWLNWPLVTFLLLVASTALAIDQNGVDSPWLWIGLGLGVLASGGLVILRQRARGTGPALERALDEGLGADWRDGVDTELAARLRRRPSLARIVLAPVSARRRGVERIATSATVPRAGRTCSTSIAIAPIDRAARYSSTCTRSSAASGSGRATCSIGLPARAGYASARTTAVPRTTSSPIR
jgi:hypothetical protein